MLVLSRKVGERIQIGENITLVVSRVVGNRVTIGIDAPNDVRIVRSELAPLSEERPARSAPVKVPAGLPCAAPLGYEADYPVPFVPRCAK